MTPLGRARRVVALAAAVSSLGHSTGCKSSRDMTSKAVLKLSPAAVMTTVGSETSLTYVVLNEKGLPAGQSCLRFDVSDSSRVRVERAGTSKLSVTGLAPGYALITARCRDRWATASVTVRQADAGPGLDAAWTTFLSGSSEEMPGDIAVDANGDVIVVGFTRSPDFPTTPGAFQTTQHGGTSRPTDAFVVKVDPTGRVRWSTVLGGPEFDEATAVETDAAGFIYVAGTAGAGFPVTDGVFQTTFAGGREGGTAGSTRGDVDGFVCKLLPDGSSVRWCSYFGVADGGGVEDIALTPDGDVVLVASVSAPGLPESWFARAAQRTLSGGRDLVVARVSGDGRAVRWATYLGGSADEGVGASVRVAPSGEGDVFVLTNTGSKGLATPSAADTSLRGPSDFFVARLTADGSVLKYGTYLGGSGTERALTHNLAVTPEGEAYVVGSTTSNDFPVTSSAWQREGRRTRETAPTTAVAKLSADGSRILAATYYGGTRGNWTEGATLAPDGRLYLSDATLSADHPLTVPGGVSIKTDVVISVLSPDLDQLEFSMRFPANDEDGGRGIVVDGAGNVYAALYSKSTDWPAAATRQAAKSPWWDVMVMKMEPVK